MNGHIHGKVIGTQQKAGYCQPLFPTIILNIWDTHLYWQNTSEFVLKLKEAPYTDRYVRCCGRSERELIPYLLSDYGLFLMFLYFCVIEPLVPPKGIMRKNPVSHYMYIKLDYPNHLNTSKYLSNLVLVY